MDVARRLREMIERGSLAVGTLLPSEQVLAEQFQVARATLRQAMAILAEEGLITRRRGAGTRVNDPQLWKRRMHATVGVVVREASLVHYGPEPQAGWNYRAWLFSLLCIELARRDLLVVPLLLPEQEALFKLLLLENRLHGVVGMPHVLDNYVGLLEERKVPVLLLETREHVPHADGVGISNRVAILQGMRELVRLGHRHIVYIGGLVGKSEGMPYRLAEDSAERFAAYREGLREAGIGFCPEWYLEAGFNREETEAIVRDWLETGTLPTAVVMFDDQLASYLIGALVGAGLAIPEEISVLGFGNITPEAQSGQLATIEVDYREMARLAARRMRERIDDGGMGEVLLRASCRFKPGASLGPVRREVSRKAEAGRECASRPAPLDGRSGV